MPPVLFQVVTNAGITLDVIVSVHNDAAQTCPLTDAHVIHNNAIFENYVLLDHNLVADN